MTSDLDHTGWYLATCSADQCINDGRPLNPYRSFRSAAARDQWAAGHDHPVVCEDFPDHGQDIAGPEQNLPEGVRRIGTALAGHGIYVDDKLAAMRAELRADMNARIDRWRINGPVSGRTRVSWWAWTLTGLAFFAIGTLTLLSRPYDLVLHDVSGLAATAQVVLAVLAFVFGRRRRERPGHGVVVTAACWSLTASGYYFVCRGWVDGDWWDLAIGLTAAVAGVGMLITLVRLNRALVKILTDVDR